MPMLRSDYQRIQATNCDQRCPERIIAHYELERVLADHLRNSAKADRHSLYGQLYSELFAGIWDHPQHSAIKFSDPARVNNQIRIISPYIAPSSTFVEIGCGDAALAVALAKVTAKSIGVDVTDALIPVQKPENFRFLRTDGTRIDLDSSSVDLVYSNQLMEHLHPDDARDQLLEIRRILKRGGRYVCITPNYVTGPHDISMYFDDVPTGFHMREYGYTSLKSLFVNSGFSHCKALVFLQGHGLTCPYLILQVAELVLSKMPGGIRRRLAQYRIIRAIFGINAIAVA